LHLQKPRKVYNSKDPAFHGGSWIKTQKRFKHLPVRDVHYKDVRILVGLEMEHLVPARRHDERIESEDKLVRAYETALGWTITGPDVFNKTAPMQTVACPAIDQDDVKSNSMLALQFRRFNDLEGVGVMYENDKFTRKHKAQLQYFKSNTRRVDGRWEVPMLIDKPGPLPNSEYLALKRFLALHRKLEKDPKLAKDYPATFESDGKEWFHPETHSSRSSGPTKKAPLAHAPLRSLPSGQTRQMSTSDRRRSQISWPLPEFHPRCGSQYPQLPHRSSSSGSGLASMP